MDGLLCLFFIPWWIISYFCILIVATEHMVVNKKNPFAYKAKLKSQKKSSGKRVGKSRPEKANNQLNRRVK